MEQNITLLCDIDPMLDDVKILVRCISLWKSHPAGKPQEVWSLDMVFQDEQVRFIHDFYDTIHFTINLYVIIFLFQTIIFMK